MLSVKKKHMKKVIIRDLEKDIEFAFLKKWFQNLDSSLKMIRH